MGVGKITSSYLNDVANRELNEALHALHGLANVTAAQALGSRTGLVVFREERDTKMILMKICGIIAGICTTGALVPQVYRLAKLRSAAEIAIGFLAVYGVGVGLFWVYGFRRDALSFQVAQLATALLIIAMILLMVAYGGTSPRVGAAVISLMLLIPAAAYLFDVNTGAIGTVAAMLAAISLLPQVLRTARLKSAHELSWMYLVTFGLGTALWFIYGLALHAPPIYIPQVVTGVLIAVTFVLKGTGLRRKGSRMADATNSPNRARTRAIRARMTPTGDAWTTAARHHDAEHTARESRGYDEPQSRLG